MRTLVFNVPGVTTFRFTLEVEMTRVMLAVSQAARLGYTCESVTDNTGKVIG